LPSTTRRRSPSRRASATRTRSPSCIVRLAALAVWLYGAGIVLWFLLHLVIGDRLGWLALVSTFAPYLFWPLPFMLAVTLVAGRRAWLPMLLAVLVFAVEYGALFDFGLLDRRPAEGEPVTILSFNTWGYSESPETAQAIVASGTPDIVLLQELSGEIAAVIDRDLAGTYPYRLLEPANRKGILSRYPLTDANGSLPSDVRWFTQAAEVDVGGQRLTVYNVHLYATTVLSDLAAGRSVADGLAGGAAAREEQATALAQDVASRAGPVIVAGDLNATDQSRAYALLTAHLDDAHRQAGSGFGHTFPAYRGSFHGLPILPRAVRIDMILYSSELQAVESRVVPEHGESDHNPVWATLIMPGR
jgi:vancomycin resistance protein VanJ